MSELTYWEPDLTPTEINWEANYLAQVELNAKLLVENEELKRASRDLAYKHISLISENKQYQAKFTQLKADAIVSLKAIDVCILATITTERQVLTHRQRNFRMRHIHQIILNEVASLGDRKLMTYEDDY
jgi:hypothetical protein